MLIRRTSILSMKTRTMDIPVTKAQLQSWEFGGELIQNAMPDLTPDQREFIKTGITSDEWEELSCK